MFRAYGSFPNSGGGTETSSLRNPLENIQTWGSSPIAPPPTPTPSPSTTSSSSPDFHTSQTQPPNINNQRHNSLRHLQQTTQFQNNLHSHQHQQQHQQQHHHH
ncbi:CLUMA_CG018118, isoform A, partial [Clunio marinus]